MEDRRSRLVVRPHKMVVMHAPFRLFGAVASSFNPGLKLLLRWYASATAYRVYDGDRLRYRVYRVFEFVLWRR